MIGEVLGNYRITAQVGSGGMGIVYAAEHLLLGKRAAIKVLKPDRCASPEIIERFFNEARAASMVKDPGIPEIFDYGRLPEGNAYLVMEMLEGQTLGDILRDRGRISAGRSLSLARLIAGTLKATHAAGIIHRDLKPDNVFIVPDEAMARGERAKILDFGIAKLQHNDLASGLQTETGRLMGTPYYMSPEQCRGLGNIDHRTDIYSLGCVLYQMLSGRPPFAMQGSGEVLAAHIHLQPKPVQQVESSIPNELAELTMRLLDKDPAMRPQTMQSVIDSLNQIACFTDMDTGEPSLGVSSDMAFEAVHDTVDDFSEHKNTTTLEASSGEYEYQNSNGQSTWMASPATSGLRRVATPLILLLGLGFGGWGAWTVLDDKSSQDEEAARPQTSAALTETKVQAPADPPIIVRELVEVPAELNYVQLTVDSDPQGARVYRVSDGVELGRTPTTVKVRQGKGTMSFLLRKSGYRNVKIDMPVAQDGQEVVSFKSRESKHGDTQGQLADGEEPEITDLPPSNPADAAENTRSAAADLYPTEP